MRRRFRRALKWTAVAALAAMALGIVGFAVLWLTVDWDIAGEDDYEGGVVLRDAAGEVMRVSLGEGDVDCRPYYRAAPEDWVVKALVASEDGEFWNHCGVRPLSALRAAVQNVTSFRRVSGASTLTMQAVRLIHPHPKTLCWKAVEAIQAMKLERAHDKLWILSEYLNRAPFGSNFIGVEAAARGWFGKGAKDLGIGEAALLAGMVQAPSRFRPDRWPERALKRREYVLERLFRLGTITAEQRAAASSVEPVLCRSPRPFLHPHYCDWALRTLGRDRAAQRRGGDCRTALDADLQARCERLVAEAAREREGLSAAIVVMRVDSAAVTALACSGDYFAADAGQVNTALCPRPAGSTLKPFLAALAMDGALVTPEERLEDEPRAYRGYRPANFDGGYRGRVTLAESLVLSLNLPFVSLLQRVGVSRFAASLRRLGFANLEDDDRMGLGLAIGNAEVTLVDLVAAYGALARGGIARAPRALADGVGEEGDELPVRVFSRAASYLVTDMLSGDERSLASLGHVADVKVPRFAWKTGTSAAHRDAWTVMWNPEYVIGVWCGHLRGGFGDRRVTGLAAAAPLAWKMARQLYPRADGPWFVEPGEVTRRRICRESGLPAGADCPRTEEGRAIAGVSATEPCTLHVRTLTGGAVTTRPRASLRLLRPEDGAVYRLVPEMPQQRIVCQAAGVAPGERVWWFVGGVPAGETIGGETFAFEPTRGTNVVTCATAAGDAVSARVTVEK